MARRVGRDLTMAFFQGATIPGLSFTPPDAGNLSRATSVNFSVATTTGTPVAYLKINELLTPATLRSLTP